VLTVVLYCNSSCPYSERLWDKSIPHRHACTPDCDFPATDEDAPIDGNTTANRYPHTTDGYANADRHADSANPHAYASDSDTPSCHRHRVRCRLRL
jgi:hypothetical protein